MDSCPAHPFEANHDIEFCRKRRMGESESRVRNALRGLDTEEGIEVLTYVLQRWNRRDETGKLGVVPNA